MKIFLVTLNCSGPTYPKLLNCPSHMQISYSRPEIPQFQIVITEWFFQIIPFSKHILLKKGPWWLAKDCSNCCTHDSCCICLTLKLLEIIHTPPFPTLTWRFSANFDDIRRNFVFNFGVFTLKEERTGGTVDWPFTLCTYWLIKPMGLIFSLPSSTQSGWTRKNEVNEL